MTINEKLIRIQTELKAPICQYNSFGKYYYRSCEDILEGLKPLLKQLSVSIVISDELILIGDRYYVKSTATLKDTEGEISTSGFAREEGTKKGMDGSQITGSATSYARKYALNGLFAIDDTKDADATNTHNDVENKPSTKGTLSDTQIKALFTLASKKGYNSTSVLNAATKKYNIPELAQLSQAQYSAMVKGYEGLKDK